MLVLTRRLQEKLIFQNETDNVTDEANVLPFMTLTILEINGRSVKVGIDAPKNIKILRNELKEKMINNLKLEEENHE